MLSSNGLRGNERRYGRVLLQDRGDRCAPGGGIASQSGASNGQMTAAMLHRCETPMSHGCNATGIMPQPQLPQDRCKSFEDSCLNPVRSLVASTGLKLESGVRRQSAHGHLPGGIGTASSEEPCGRSACASRAERRRSGRVDMLCTHCEESRTDVTRRSVFPLPDGNGHGEWAPLRPVLCSDCGSVLPEADLTGTMLGKISQLARFGLVDGGPPLLEPASTGRTRARRM